MPIVPLVIASGSTVSSAAALTTPDRKLAIYCPSHAAGQVFIAFSQTSGTGPFERLSFPEGWGGASVVSAAAGWAIVTPPTPWYRIEQAPATVDNRSFAVYENRIGF